MKKANLLGRYLNIKTPPNVEGVKLQIKFFIKMADERTFYGEIDEPLWEVPGFRIGHIREETNELSKDFIVS